MALTPCVGPPNDTTAAIGYQQTHDGGDGICELYGQLSGNTLLSWSTTGNLVQNNTLSTNLLYGLLKVGQYQPEEIATPTCAHIGGPPVPTIIYTPPTAPAVNPDCTAGTAALASNSNTFNSNTWTGNGTAAPLANGANVMDGTTWGGGCASVATDCINGQELVFEGPNTSFPTASNTTPFTLLVCNGTTSSTPLKVGSELTFYDNNPGESGTFFVTQSTILQPNGVTTNAQAKSGQGCNQNTFPFTTISVQALNPAKVSTDFSPSGQSYILGTGSLITVNVNGTGLEPGTNVWGTGAQSNSCTPDGANGIPNIFGTTDGVGHPSSTTLDAGTGGVNATYDAC
jgi:hypothetical protein